MVVELMDFFQHTALEELDVHRLKREKEKGPQTWPHTTHKNQLKIKHRLKYMS